MNSAERLACLAAIQAGGAGPRTLSILESALGPIEAWWRRRRALLVPSLLSERRRVPLLDPTLDARCDAGLRAAAARGYAPRLVGDLPVMGCLPEPPLVLYVRGVPPSPETPALAIVGARRATAYGLRTARRLASEAASRGVAILSGLARGIDGAAHRGALDVGGTTVAVLGAGPDIVYPPEHEALQRQIEAEGVVITEHLPGTPPLPHHFPRRNRIIVAMSRALLVVEARVKSGTLTSVRWAADLGREVLVVPGPIDSPLSEGPLLLLREGATAISGVADILEALGVESGGKTAAVVRDPAEVSEAEGRLLALLGGEALDLDEIVRVAGESPGRTLALLLALEMRGLIVREGLAYRARAAAHESPPTTAEER